MPPEAETVQDKTVQNQQASSQAGAVQPAQSQAAGGQADKPADKASAVAGKPEGLDDAYWDKATGFKADALKADLASLTELRAFKAEHDVRMTGVPKEAKDYQIDLTGFEAPEGIQITMPGDDDPFIADVKSALHKAQVPQEVMRELAIAKANADVRMIQKWNEDMKAERAKLGDKADDRINAVETALVGRLGEKGKALKGLLVSAEVVEAFEGLLRTTAAPGPGATQSNGQKVKLDMTGMSTTAKFATIYAQNAAKAPASRKAN